MDDITSDDDNGVQDVFVRTGAISSAVSSNPTEFQLLNNRWEMLSLPCVPPQRATVADLFGDDIEGNYGESWMVYTYDPSIEVGSPYVDVGEAGVLRPGVGFWIKQISGVDVTLDFPAGSRKLSTYVGSAACTAPGGCQEELLFTTADKPITWNMIGNPLPQAEGIAFDELMMRLAQPPCVEAGCTIDAGFDQSVVFNRFFHYNGVGYDEAMTGTTLNPWYAYWVSALPDSYLKEPKVVFPAAQ